MTPPTKILSLSLMLSLMAFSSTANAQSLLEEKLTLDLSSLEDFSILGEQPSELLRFDGVQTRTPPKRQTGPRKPPPNRARVPPSRKGQPRANQPRKNQPRPRPQPRTRKKCPPRVTVPVDVGIGPTFNLISGPVFRDQPVHFGGRLNMYAVIDRKFLRENWACIPPQYRSYARGVSEARIKPIFLNLIPRELIVSPRIPDLNNTGIYGIGWNLFSLGLAPISDPFRVSLTFGLPVKYMFIHSTEFDSPTHFARPGLEAMFDIEIPFTQRFLFSFGWASQVFIPQRVGGSIIEFGPLNQSVWHVGQAYFKLHFRVPYETSI